jgi:PAS domain S-box-containing protein
MAMVVAEDRATLAREWERVRAGKLDFDYAFRIRRSDGEVRSIRSVGTAQRDPAGEFEWLVGINEDITDRVAAEAERLLDAHRLEMAVKSTRFGIWRYDVLARTSYWSERQMEIFGVDRTLTEPEFEAIIHPDDRANVVALRGRALAGERNLVANFRIIRPDGRLVHIYSNMVLWAGPDGAPRWIAGINEDVTEQALQNERERALRDQLFQSQKLETLGTLAGGVAHDFNNLLTGMLGFVELSQHALPPDRQVRSYLDHVRGGGQRARDLVKRLLLFARRGPDAKRKPVQLEQLVEEAIPLLTATLPSSIGIQRDLVTGVGSVLGDAGQLQQVLMNLGVNAAHAIGALPGRITLRVRPAEIGGAENPAGGSGTYACLEVADTGCGMDEATQARIFDPFFTTKKQGEGSGLGLSIVHGIVRDHGGFIRVHSALGRGTTFEIFLPVTREAPAVVRPPVAEGGTPEGAGRRVLVVDDEESIRLVARALLLRAGFRVEVHDGAESAARMFAAAPASFALVLADLSMPGLNGAELIRQLRAIRPEQPAVLMSGDHDRYGPVTGSGLAGVVLLAKPFDAMEFFAALGRGLDTRAISPSG